MAQNKGAELYTALNVTPITSLLDLYAGSPAIFTDESIAPDDFVGDRFINFYLGEPVNPNLGYGLYVRVVACHAATEKASLELAATVVRQLNRNVIDGGGMCYCEQLPPIPPADDTDVYNTPVSVTIKSA